MVGMTGFEPATTWSQTMCSTKLSHIPIVVRPVGIEPATFWSVAKRSIQLSYERKSVTIVILAYWLKIVNNQNKIFTFLLTML